MKAFVPGKTGLDYTYENIDDLEKKVDRLLSDPERCAEFAQAGRDRVEGLMGTEQMIDGFMAAIRHVHEKCSC